MLFNTLNRAFGRIRGIASAGRGAMQGMGFRAAFGATEAAFRFGGTRAGMRVGSAMMSGAIYGQQARMAIGPMAGRAYQAGARGVRGAGRLAGQFPYLTGFTGGVAATGAGFAFGGGPKRYDRGMQTNPNWRPGLTM